MPALEKQVRVFISSTFRDMHAERDHLVTVVFPELRERIEQLGLEFFDVDLRWGVPAKDANGETANSWEYCKKWIDRVEPFFVSLLGQRYGFVPKANDIKDKADRQAYAKLSITEMEIRHAVLTGRIRRRSFFYLRQTRVPDQADAAAKAEFVEDEAKVERLKALIKSGSRPVREYPCKWTGNGFSDLDVFGRMVLEDLWSGVLRDERYVSKDVWRQVLGADFETDARYTDESQPVPPDIAAKIVVLAKPSPKEPLDAEREQMEAFAAARLKWFQGRTMELEQLTNFINSTDEKAPRLAYVAAVPGQGKSALIAKLAESLSRPEVRDQRSEVSQKEEQSDQSAIRNPKSAIIIAHFVGATERSASAHALVERLLGELDRSGIAWPADEQKEGEETKRDFNSLCLRLAKRLGDYVGERRIVILLDALNQLSDGHDLSWLPLRLGPGVRVVVSCIEDSAAGGPRSVVAENPTPTDATERVPPTTEQRVLRALAARQPAPLRVPLGPLTEEDVRTIVVAYLKEYCHELDGEHLDTLCAIPQARNPLYLLVMLNELRTLGGNDLNRIVPALIAEMPQKHPDTVSLFRWVLQRLEVFGADAVRWWCLYLAHGRVGMASHELADLLARKLGPDAAATALRIERGLRRYLQHRGPQLDFFHGQLRQAVMEHYAPKEGEGVSRKDAEAQRLTDEIHREMAEYFTACAKGADLQKEWETDSVRGFAECVFHLTKAGQHEQAAALLTSFPFLLHKLRVGLLEGVFEDYDMVRSEAPADVVKRLEIWSDFFREKAHIMRRGNDEWPAHKILLQLAVEHADDSPLTIGAEQWLSEGRCDCLWLRRVPRLSHAQKNPCLAVLEGHTGYVTGAMEMADGRLLSWSEDRTLRLWDSQSGACLAVLEGYKILFSGVLALSDRCLLTWGFKMLRLWDSENGACLAVLEGHSDWINGALVLPDGRLLSWSEDKTLRLWDGESGACLAVLKGHIGKVQNALMLSDGRLLSWGDKTLRFWDGQSGKYLAVLDGHTEAVGGGMELKDGRVLSWSEDGTLRLWDNQSGACLAVLKGHTMQIYGARALPDGRLLSWSEDKTLRLWDSQSGACLVVLEGHSGGVKDVLMSSGERLLSWAYGPDDTLRLWDSLGSSCLAVLEGHTDGIKGALELCNGRMISWSKDMTLRMWKSQGNACLAVLEGHTDAVTGVLALSDGRLLSWSEDKTLRLWDSQTEACQAVLKGHIGKVLDALMLPSGRVLSRAWDELGLWDIQSGTCLSICKGLAEGIWGASALSDGRLLSWSWNALRLREAHSCAYLTVLEGHTGSIQGALELSNGRLLSWASWPDSKLRLWDGQSGRCLAVLEGHILWVSGAVELSDGRLLSWGDKTLRLWDGQSGKCLAVLDGHTEAVEGGMELKDGRVLSWSEDRTLRLWDNQSGACLTNLEGHTDRIKGALELCKGRVLSWSWDGTVRLWNGQNGVCLEVVPEDQVAKRYPDWFHARAKFEKPEKVLLDFFTDAAACLAHLRHKTILSNLASWNAESEVDARCLLPDGTVVATECNGQVCILKLHHGQRRITLAEAEELLGHKSRSQTSEVSGQIAEGR